VSQVQEGKTSVVDASGYATAVIRPRTGQTWTMQQVSVELLTAPPAGCTAALRKNGWLITPMVPAGDSAGGDPPIVLRGGPDAMTVSVYLATPGQTMRAFFIYDDGRPDT